MGRSAVPASQIPAYYFELDAEDRIVNASESWDEFARNNDGEHLVFSNIRGSSIWDHIADSQTADLYRRIFARAREGRIVNFFLRCDSPTVKRLLSVIVENLPERGRLGVSTVLYRADLREPIDVRAGTDDRPTLILPACSWCEKVKLPETDWQQIERVAVWLAEHDLPSKCQVSYTVCPHCRSLIERQLELAR